MPLKSLSRMLLAFSLVVGTVWGNDITDSKDDAIHLNLSEVISLSTQQHYSVRVAKSQWEEQKQATLETKASFLPQIKAQMSQSRQKHNYLGSSLSSTSGDEYYGQIFNAFDAQLNLSQVLFNRNLFKAIQMAKQYESAKESNYLAAREAASLQGASYFLEAFRGKARLDAAQYRAKWAKDVLEQSRRFEDVGKGSLLDTARAVLQYENEYQTYSEASTQYASALVTLAQWLGLSQNHSFMLDEPKASFDEKPLEPLETLLADAMKNRPDLAAQRTQLKALQVSVETYRSEKWPILGLSASAGVNGGEPDNTDKAYSLGIGLEIPIYTGGDIDSRIKQAQAQVFQQKVTIQNLESEVEKDIREAIFALNGAKTQWVSSQKGVKAAESVLKLTQSRYREGLSTNLEVAEAQDTLARAQENLIRAQYSYYLAQTSLAYASGILEKAFSTP